MKNWIFEVLRFRTLVPETGLEPVRSSEHRILSPACLPIPPLGHLFKDLNAILISLLRVQI